MSIATIFLLRPTHQSYDESGGDSGRGCSLSCLSVQVTIPQIFLPLEVSLGYVREIIMKEGEEIKRKKRKRSGIKSHRN